MAVSPGCEVLGSGDRSNGSGLAGTAIDIGLDRVRCIRDLRDCRCCGVGREEDEYHEQEPAILDLTRRELRVICEATEYLG